MAPNEVQLWRARLDLADAALGRLETFLDAAERQRAARFHFDRDRRRFIAAHGWLRELLAGQIQLDPSDILFDYNPNGKPRLAASCQAHNDLRFNLSHAGSLALFAFTAGREIGVDLEFVKPMNDVEAVARQSFSPEDCARLAAASETERTALFHRLWTRREAIAKCTGLGIAQPDVKNTFTGTVLEITPAPGCLGAVAVEHGQIDLGRPTSLSPAPDDPAPARIH